MQNRHGYKYSPCMYFLYFNILSPCRDSCVSKQTAYYDQKVRTWVPHKLIVVTFQGIEMVQIILRNPGLASAVPLREL